MAVRGMGAQGKGDNRDRAPCAQAGSRKGDCRELWVGWQQKRCPGMGQEP